MPSWFVRINLGLGPPAFSSQTNLLRKEGYAAVKIWVDADAAYFFVNNLGIGPWGSMSFWRSSGIDSGAKLEENSFFVGGEAPIRGGTRSLSIVFAPRLGFFAGDQSFGGTVPTQTGFVWGAQLALTSNRAHIQGAVQYLRALSSAPGTLGRSNDYGGLGVVFGGVINE